MYTDVHTIYRYICVLVHIHICSKLCPLREPRSNGTPVIMSTPRGQILVSKYLSPIKGLRAHC